LAFLLQLSLQGEQGLALTNIVSLLDKSPQEVNTMLSKSKRLVRIDRESGNWVLAFGRLGSIIKAYDYLYRQSPTTFEAMVNTPAAHH
jgi:hypothetical protein